MLPHIRLRAGLAVVSLAVLLLAAPVRAAEVDKLLPNDTESIAVINVRQILDSALIKKVGLDKVKDEIKKNDQVHKVLDDLGFDLFKDLDTIIAAGPGGTDTDKGLIIVSGKFDKKKFDAKALALSQDMKDTVKAISVPDGLGGKFEMYEVTIPDQPQSIYVNVANNSTILASPGKDYLIDALAKINGQKKTTLKNKDMAALIGRMDARSSMYVGILGAALSAALEKSPLNNDEAAKEIVDKIHDVSFGLSITQDIGIDIGLGAKDAKGAADLNDKIKDGLKQALALVTFLSMNNKQLDPVLDVLKTVKPKLTDKNISIKAELSGEELDKLIPKQ
jgi:hypothetical protein